MENIFPHPPLRSISRLMTTDKNFSSITTRARFSLDFPRRGRETFPCTFSRCFVCRRVSGQQTLVSRVQLRKFSYRTVRRAIMLLVIDAWTDNRSILCEHQCGLWDGKSFNRFPWLFFFCLSFFLRLTQTWMNFSSRRKHRSTVLRDECDWCLPEI